MATIDDLLSTVNSRTEDPELRKTAEARFLADLQEEGQVEDEAANPYANHSLEDLMKLASEKGIEVPTTEPVELDENTAEQTVEDVAYQQLMGRTMAHSMTHEMGAMKIAMVNGKCRICKEKDLDVKGASVCSGCKAKLQPAA